MNNFSTAGDVSTDPNVEAVRARLLYRAVVGLRKYGRTTAGSPKIGVMGWLQHLLDELCDAAVYIESLANSTIALGINVWAVGPDGVSVVQCGVLAMRLDELAGPHSTPVALDETLILLRDGEGREWEQRGAFVARSEEVLRKRIAERKPGEASPSVDDEGGGT